MSKRTKLKMRRVRMELTKYVFNSRYIVRNTLALTVVMSVIVMVMSIATVAGDKTSEDDGTVIEAENTIEDITTEEVVVEAPVSIDLVETPYMNSDSISMLMAVYDVDSESVVEARNSQMVTEGNDPYEHKFIAISDGVNIRREASTDSDIVGALYLNDMGDVISVADGWFYISFGDVTGYVREDFVLTGSDIEDYLDDSQVDESGLDTQTDTSEEEEFEEEEIEDAAEEITTEAPVTTEIPATTEAPVTTEAPATTEAPVTTEAPATTEAPVTTEAPATTEATTTEQPAEDGSNETSVSVTNRGQISISDDELNLMASIMTLECGGESYEGQLAVANVILNRLQSGTWGSTINDVVYAPGQFSTATSSSLSYYLTNGAQASCIKAAKEALSGTNNVGSYIFFKPTSYVNTSTLDSYTTIGNHVFY